MYSEVNPLPVIPGAAYVRWLHGAVGIGLVAVALRSMDTIALGMEVTDERPTSGSLSCQDELLQSGTAVLQGPGGHGPGPGPGPNHQGEPTDLGPPGRPGPMELSLSVQTDHVTPDLQYLALALWILCLLYYSASKTFSLFLESIHFLSRRCPIRFILRHCRHCLSVR